MNMLALNELLLGHTEVVQYDHCVEKDRALWNMMTRKLKTTIGH